MAFGDKTPEELAANFSERAAAKAEQIVDPAYAAEIAAEKAEREARIADVLGEAALIQSGDPAAVAREKARQEQRDAEWEKQQKQAELDRARNDAEADFSGIY